MSERTLSDDHLRVRVSDNLGSAVPVQAAAELCYDFSESPVPGWSPHAADVAKTVQSQGRVRACAVQPPCPAAADCCYLLYLGCGRAQDVATPTCRCPAPQLMGW